METVNLMNKRGMVSTIKAINKNSAPVMVPHNDQISKSVPQMFEVGDPLQL